MSTNSFLISFRNRDEGQEQESEEEEEEEEEKIAELGEGIYIKSGDEVNLRELVPLSAEQGSFDGGSYVAYGGGFAVLQEQTPSTIIIEKVGRGGRLRSKKSPKAPKLIKSGDTVLFKLISNKSERNKDTTETRYLSTHRGWYLKWVLSRPTKGNGFFTLHTHEVECSDHGSSANQTPSETQASYLTLGGSFTLMHKRWSKYSVGASVEVSAKYGGRMLGLFSKLQNNYEEDFETFDGEDDDQQPYVGEKSRCEWMRPLQLRAYEASVSAASMKSLREEVLMEDVAKDAQLVFNSENMEIDVPVWLEMMNRKDRLPQLTYAVRVSPRNTKVDDGDRREAFVRLRTGHQLSHITRVGLNWRNSAVSTPRRISIAPGGMVEHQTITSQNRQSDPLLVSPLQKRASSFSDLRHAGADENSLLKEAGDDEDVDASSEGAWSDSGYGFDPAQSVDDLDPLTIDPADPLAVSHPKKSRILIGKIAKSVSSKTKSTGKKVVKQSVKVGKGTVNASVKVGKGTVNASVKVGKGTVNVGKAIITAPSRSKNPPKKEPKTLTAPRRSRKEIERALHAAVTPSMKRIERREGLSPTLESSQMIAGELSALEQSCRTVSNMLHKMSSLPPSNSMATTFSHLLASEVNQKTQQEEWFLCGGAVQLGVVPPSNDSSKGKLLHDCLVARCLWESHWREGKFLKLKNKHFLSFLN